MSHELILGVILFCLACIAAILKKTYFELPLIELKKRSALGEKTSELRQTLGYGPALRGLLWLALGLTIAASLTLLARSLPIWVGILVAALVVYYIFSYLPNSKVSRLDKQLTKLVSPGLNWLLKYLARYIDLIYSPLAKRYSPEHQTVFDETDLLELIKQLRSHKSTRIEPEVFLNLERSLSFNNHKISDHMTPAKKVKTLLQSDVIGPVLINELHENGQGYALVQAEPKGDITGILALSDLSIKSQGSVEGHMKKDVYFVSQNDTLSSVIKAFFDSRNLIFIVKNEDQKFTGVISLEAVLKQLMGPLPQVPTGDNDKTEDVAKTDKKMVE